STLGARALARALEDAGIDGRQLKLVISAGISRDYPPSWGMAAEIMRLNDVPSECLGVDLTVGCMGTLAALDVVLGWLCVEGGGYAAVIGPERWSQTVDRSDGGNSTIWANSDGGAAIVVGYDVPHPSRADFLGANFVSYSGLNGYVLIKYGGTRHPVAPPG